MRIKIHTTTPCAWPYDKPPSPATLYWIRTHVYSPFVASAYSLKR